MGNVEITDSGGLKTRGGLFKATASAEYVSVTEAKPETLYSAAATSKI